MAMIGGAMWKRIPTAWAKFLLILIPILAVSTVAFAIAFFFTKSADLHKAVTDRVTAVAEINAIALERSLSAGDTLNTFSIISAMAVDRDIRCIEIADTDGHVGYSWPRAGCLLPKSAPTVVKEITSDTARLLGGMALRYSFDSADALLRTEIVNAAWLLLVLLVVTIVTALFAFRITTGVPLAKLIASIRAAEQKGRRELVEWQSNDELGDLIAAYNRLLVKLAYEEVSLRKSEERLSLAIAATRSSVWDIDLTNGQVWWSSEFPAILGYAADELTMAAATLENLIHPEDRDRVLAESLRHIAGETESYSNIYRLRTRDGGYLWVEDRATALRDANGVALRLTGIIADVTERKQAELDLASERAILQATLENVDQGMVMFDQNLRLVTFNRRAADLLNVPLKVLVKRPTFDEMTQCQIERGEFVGEKGASELAHLWDRMPNEYFTFNHRRPDGTVIKICSNPLFMGGFVCTYTDVTAETRATEETLAAMQATERAYAELKETQASLVQAEKMASLGLLVAGIAHEINTPVGIAYSCASLLATRTRELVQALEGGNLKKSDLSAYAAAATESTRLMSGNLSRAAELIRSFKHVAVDQASAELRRFDLKTYLNEVVTSLGPRLRTTPHRVSVSCPDGIAINGYPGAFSQVVTNLVMNALDHAFETKPEGTIAIAVEAAPGSGEVDLRFSDDGKGIPPAALEKIFEPFFTTRRGSGGSGLGLHIVFNLVTQSLGGRISVDSTEGEGTTFRIRFPREAPAGTGGIEEASGA